MLTLGIVLAYVSGDGGHPRAQLPSSIHGWQNFITGVDFPNTSPYPVLARRADQPAKVEPHACPLRSPQYHSVRPDPSPDVKRIPHKPSANLLRGVRPAVGRVTSMQSLVVALLALSLALSVHADDRSGVQMR